MEAGRGVITQAGRVLEWQGALKKWDAPLQGGASDTSTGTHGARALDWPPTHRAGNEIKDGGWAQHQNETTQRL